jgi:hypothetical protein
MNNRNLGVMAFKANVVGGALLAALTLAVPGAAVAAEREEALTLCRAAIADAFQVSADETGAHFQGSATTARAYTMRFQVRSRDEKPQAATCKVRRGALAVVEINPAGPAARRAADQESAADAGQVAPLTRR